MKKCVYYFVFLIFFSCQKTDINLEGNKVGDNVLEIPSKPRPPIGGGAVVSPSTAYLIPSGSGSYTALYAGIPINFTQVTYPLSNTGATRSFSDYGTYFTVNAFGAASTPSSSNTIVSGPGNSFTFIQTYCSNMDSIGLCKTWSTRTFSAEFVKVLNPPANSPSQLALVPPSYFSPITIVPID